MGLEGVPGSRTGDDLNRGLEPRDDALHEPGGILPYEWWYFEAAFDHHSYGRMPPSTTAIRWSRSFGR
jgi:hypothetical protein